MSRGAAWTATRVAAAILWMAAASSAQDPGDTIVCLVPWSQERDAPRLAQWFRDELGQSVEVLQEPEAGLGSGAAREATLLMGYERTVLEALAEEAALAPWPGDPGVGGDTGCVAHLFYESWSPVQTDAGVGPELEPLRRWWDLTRPELWGSVFLRLPDAESREGLVLGQLAVDRDLNLSFEAERLVLGDLGSDTLKSPRAPVRGILERLGAGQATLAPVREVVQARRQDWPLTYIVPEEGYYAIPLGVAFPAHVPESERRRLGVLFEGPSLERLCVQLDLEPVDPTTAGLPEWMNVVAARRVPVAPAAYHARMEIAQLYESGTARNPEIEPNLPMDLFDLVMILTSIVLLTVVAKSVRPQRRVRKS